MSAPVREGEILLGKYRIERVLGAGGMGVVVAALHVQLDQRVAIKFLLPAVANNPQIVARFLREARAAAKIQSEHVARVLDVGTMETGAPYMVLEYLQGADLADIIHQRGQIGTEEAVTYVLHACEALAEAHAAGIVHRDLKPANLYLARRANGTQIVKVLDFGISKATAAGEESLGLTATTAVIGSPLYMSPEQMASAKTVDARTDIWALGVTLYEMLVGATPYTSDTITGLIAAVLQTSPAPIRDKRPDVPPGLEAAVMRCLEKSTSRRYASVAQLATDLAPFAPKIGAASLERITQALGPSGSAPAIRLEAHDALALADTAASFGRTANEGTTQRTSRSRVWIAVLGAAMVVVGGGGAFAAWRITKPPARAAASADTSASTLPATSASAPAPVFPPPAETASAAPAPDAGARTADTPRPRALPGAPLLPSATAKPSALPPAPPTAPTPPKGNPLDVKLKD